MQKILKLDFKKTSNEIDSASYGHVDFTDKSNLEKIEKYILPIIAENEGWGTKDLTIKGFREDPFQYQDAIDATLFDNVHVAFDDLGNPSGLIEFLEETLDKPISKTRMQNLIEMIENKDSWNELIEKSIVSKELVDKFFPKLKTYLTNKKIYSEIGVVVRSDLQGKKTGIAESLYQMLSEGILFGWTNNPIIVAQWRKYYKHTLYFPMFSQKLENLEDLAGIAILNADLKTYTQDRLINLEFGTINSPYFVSSRNSYYLELAESLASKGKITQLDKGRIEYCIQKTSVQGALFSFS